MLAFRAARSNLLRVRPPVFSAPLSLHGVQAWTVHIARYSTVGSTSDFGAPNVQEPELQARGSEDTDEESGDTPERDVVHHTDLYNPEDGPPAIGQKFRGVVKKVDGSTLEVHFADLDKTVRMLNKLDARRGCGLIAVWESENNFVVVGEVEEPTSQFDATFGKWKCRSCSAAEGRDVMLTRDHFPDQSKVFKKRECWTCREARTGNVPDGSRTFLRFDQDAVWTPMIYDKQDEKGIAEDMEGDTLHEGFYNAWEFSDSDLDNDELHKTYIKRQFMQASLVPEGYCEPGTLHRACDVAVRADSDILMFETRRYLMPANDPYHTGNKKVVMTVKVEDLDLHPQARENLLLLVGTRYKAVTDTLRLVGNSFDTVLENKRMVLKQLNELLAKSSGITGDFAALDEEEVEFRRRYYERPNPGPTVEEWRSFIMKRTVNRIPYPRMVGRDGTVAGLLNHFEEEADQLDWDAEIYDGYGGATKKMARGSE